MFRTVTIKGMELSPIDRLAAMITSPYVDDQYSLEENSRLLTKGECYKTSFKYPLTPYSIPPKSDSFENFTGSTNGKILVTGYLGLMDGRGFWMVQCVECKKYSIREHDTLSKKRYYDKLDFCFSCNKKSDIKKLIKINKLKRINIKAYRWRKNKYLLSKLTKEELNLIKSNIKKNMSTDKLKKNIRSMKHNLKKDKL